MADSEPGGARSAEQASRFPESEPLQPPPTPEVKAQGELLSSSDEAQARQLFTEAADRAQAKLQEARQAKDGEEIKTWEEATRRLHAMSEGEASSTGDYLEDMQPYEIVADRYIAENAPSDDDLAERARGGLTTDLARAELARAQAELVASRIMLVGDRDMGTSEVTRELTTSQLERAMQLVAELSHLVDGGNRSQAPMAMERLGGRLAKAQELSIEASRRKIRGLGGNKTQ